MRSLRVHGAVRLRRWLRLLVVIFAVVGLAPAAEAADAMATAFGTHAVVEASNDGCTTDCDDGCDRAGCHGSVHHCGCCAPLARIQPSSPDFPTRGENVPQRWMSLRERIPPAAGEAPPRRPPKA